MTPTSTLTILGQSFRLMARRWPVVLTLYGITLFLVLPVVLALRATLADAFLYSPVIERMFSGFDSTTYGDFTATFQEAVHFLQRTTGPFMFVSLIIHGLLGAGVVTAVAGEGTAAEVLQGTARYLGRSFRLLFYALSIAVLVVAVWTFALGAIWMAMTAGNAVETDYVTAALVVVALFLLPVAVIALATEYGRVLIVRDDRRQVFRSLMDGFVFVFRHPLRMVAQHGSIIVVMLLLVAMYWLIDDLLGMTTVVGILVMFVVQQLSVLGRIGVRVWQTASAVTLVDALTPEVPAAAAVAPVPVPVPVSPPVDIVLSAPLPTPPAKPAVRARTPVKAAKKPARKPVRKPVRRPRAR